MEVLPLSNNQHIKPLFYANNFASNTVPHNPGTSGAFLLFVKNTKWPDYVKRWWKVATLVLVTNCVSCRESFPRWTDSLMLWTKKHIFSLCFIMYFHTKLAGLLLLFELWSCTKVPRGALIIPSVTLTPKLTCWYSGHRSEIDSDQATIESIL